MYVYMCVTHTRQWFRSWFFFLFPRVYAHDNKWGRRRHTMSNPIVRCIKSSNDACPTISAPKQTNKKKHQKYKKIYIVVVYMRYTDVNKCAKRIRTRNTHGLLDNIEYSVSFICQLITSNSRHHRSRALQQTVNVCRVCVKIVFLMGEQCHRYLLGIFIVLII